MKTNLHDEPLEKKIISTLLVNSHDIPIVKSNIVPEAFHNGQFRMIYSKMLSLYDRGITADYLGVVAQAKSDGDKLDSEEMFNLAMKGGSSANIACWCKSLMEFYSRRVCHDKAMEIQEISKGTEDAEKRIRTCIKHCNEALELAQFKAAVSTEDILNDTVKFMSEVNQKPDQHIVQYGIEGMDSEIHHLRKQIHIVGAPPNTGKTGLVLSILERQIEMGIKHVVFSHESPRNDLMRRLISMRANISSRETMEITTAVQMQRLQGAIKSIKEQSGMFKFYGSGDYSHSTNGIESALEAMINSGFKPDMVSVDYLQNMTPSKEFERANRVEQLERMIHALSNIFKKFDIAGLWLSQINRDKNRDNEKNRFIMSDLKGSSAIEQEADYITFIQRVRPADTNCKTPMAWYSAKMRAGNQIEKAFEFNTPNGKILKVIDRFEGVV